MPKVLFSVPSMLLVVAACVAGCGSNSGGNGGGSTESTGAVSQGPEPRLDDHPSPVAVVSIGPGHSVEFYDSPDGVLIMERGKADAATSAVMPSLTSLGVAHRFADLFSALRPDLPVPPEVATLDAEFDSTARVPLRTAEVVQPEVGPSAGPVSGGDKWPADNACGNGCCDPTWLNNNVCKYYSYEYNWFLLDYGHSFANAPSICYFQGAVCAGIGTSSFQASSSSGWGGTWSVPEATWSWWYWFSGECGNSGNKGWVNTEVNTASNQHLHSYCGGFDYQ